MKKIFTSLLIVLPLVLSAQSGSGTSGDPYYGTISTSVLWDPDSYVDGKIYVGTASNNDLTIGNGVHLTIWPGATIIFTQNGSDLKITGTGRITANAVPSNKIIFTKDPGISYWGHIIFDGMSGSNTSLLDNCIIEYGKLTGTTLIYDNAGGGICANYSYLTVTECTFRNNYALFGGGLFVGYGQNPTIARCTFEDNTAREAGGGIYVYDNSSVEIVNCIFDGNYADGVSATYYGGGGVQFGIGTTNAKIINSVFVNNIADRSGNGVFFFSSGQIINSILWGSSDQVSFRTSSGSSSNCGIEGYISSYHYSNCFNLNSSNSADNGPNFNATNGSDWSIQFKSPCRDTGTDTGAPATDYDGNNRIGTTDIGAYEVQYSRWDGSSGTSWSTDANWEEDLNPGSSSNDVVIPSGLSNYPTSGTTNFTISSGRYLIVEPGAQVTFNVLTNSSGTLRFLENASGAASVLFNSYSDSGTEDIRMYLTGDGGPAYAWHYIAVPATTDKTIFTNISAYNLLAWDESEIVDDDMQGWQWHDGYDGTNGFSSLSTKKGYNFYHIYTDTVVKLQPVTSLLSSLGSIDLQWTEDGKNLLGNSLLCSIDWDEVAVTGNVRDAVYFTEDNQLVSYVNGVGSPGGTTGIIPPLQGFFVKALESGTSLDFTGANVKTHGTVNRYKGKSIIPLIRFELRKDDIPVDETVIRFDYFATDKVDNEFDAEKLFTSNPTAQIYSETGNDKFVINGLPFPEESSSIPLTIQITDAGNYEINRTQLDGLEHYSVKLTDTYQGITIDLEQINKYSFASETGVFNDRFFFTIETFATDINNINITDKAFNIYTYSNILNVEPLSDEWNNIEAEINIYDLTGRRIQAFPKTVWYQGDKKQLGFNHANGIYIIEITDGIRRTTQKIMHK